jgi:thiamine biosynthesis lipoprotein
MSVRASADIMGMPVSVHIVDPGAGEDDVEMAFAYLRHIDQAFSTYKPDSETERINRGELPEADSSEEMRTVIALCEQTRSETEGYFNARYRGRFDPSGLVKGYAIRTAAELLRQRCFRHFYVEAGGDIQTSGHNRSGRKWRVGIRDPFNISKLLNVVHLSGEGIATSGSYERGQHVYDPVGKRPANTLASVTVVAADVFDADRFVTAAFAMGERALHFLEATPGLEGCVVNLDSRMEWTSGFPRYMAA